MKVRVTRRIEFDAGHRIPNHESKCRHMHGHRYRLECTLEGPVQEDQGRADEGMVLDFGFIKAIMMKEVHDLWDHRFLICMSDGLISVVDIAVGLVVLPFVPTAENMARYIFDLLSPLFQEEYGDDLELVRVRLYETPNCWADAVKEIRDVESET